MTVRSFGLGKVPQEVAIAVVRSMYLRLSTAMSECKVPAAAAAEKGVLLRVCSAAWRALLC